MRVCVAAVVAVMGLIEAAPAAAQAPSYGGGLLPATAAKGGYTPTLGIVLPAPRREPGR